MLVSRSLPGNNCSSHNVALTFAQPPKGSTYAKLKRASWSCSAVASESDSPQLDITENKTQAVRSNIVPRSLSRFPSRSDDERQSNFAKVLKKLPAAKHSAWLSSAGKARSPGGLNTVLETYSEQPEDDRIPLHGGLPHPSAFPFAQLTVKLTSGSTLTIDDPDLVPEFGLLMCLPAC